MATTTIGAPGVVFPDGTTQSTAAITGATGIPILNVFTTPGTWTKSATVKAIKVTVVGGGGNSGSATGTNFPGTSTGFSGSGGGGGTAITYYPAASLPGPQPYTVGGAAAASSFGVAPVTVITGSGGASGASATASPGNPVTTSSGAGGAGSGGQLNVTGGTGVPAAPVNSGGGNSLYGNQSTSAQLYGGGAPGVRSDSATTVPGLSGAAGLVIIEEFY